ncbi:MAG: PIN domain-containing protein [Acidobacteriota bacterium]
MRYHLDTDFLIYALSQSGPERKRLAQVVSSEAEIQISAIAWYEFARGPRTPEQLAVARDLFGEHGVVPFSEELAMASAETFRSLGSPRKRAADVGIGVTAGAMGATLLTRYADDFAGIPRVKVEGVAE